MNSRHVMKRLRRLLPLLPKPLREALQALDPRPMSTEERLAAFPTRDLPLEKPATIRWNRHQVPFLEAQTDRDLAFLIGLVQGHLRLGQITLFKRFFYGRLSEIAGPLALDLDHAVRILDYGRAVPEWKARMPEATRVWVQAFADGLNCYQERMPAPPPEWALLGIRPEPYTFDDILVGSRFAGTDYTWLNYFEILPHRDRPDFAQLWNRTLETGEVPTASKRPDVPEGEFEDLLLGAGRQGSNAVAVAPHRSASGAAMLAGDPHLGLSLPNVWVMMGLRSPTIHAVGLAIVGLPMFAIGRNPDLAWGGTNLRAASSDLYDVSKLPEAAIETTETEIRCRFWRKVRRPVRRTPFGPIITDSKIARCGDATIALRWVGHEPTDDMSCFVAALRARTPEAFRQAFDGYGVSGQNMLFADTAGNIGHIMAVTQPRRRGFPQDDPVLDASDPATHWQGFAGVMDLPLRLNPKHGVLASANDRPADTDVPIGFTFGSDDRIRRLYQLLAKRERLTRDDIVDLQTDTLAPDAGGLAAALARELAAVPENGNVAEDPMVARLLRKARQIDGTDGTPPALAARLAAWDGDYAVDSAGAVAFETFLYHLVLGLYGGRRPADLPELFSQLSFLTTYLMPDLLAIDAGRRTALLRQAAAAASVDAARYPTWGDMHRLRLGHSLARLPLVRSSFIVASLPAGGSRQTPMKMAHGLVNGRHCATFGSMARHISDMADLDSNWFVILGGNDGYLGSANFADQLELWQERRSIRMPLRPETVAAEFPIEMRLTPTAAEKQG